MVFNELIKGLEKALGGDLPGRDAQFRMANTHRIKNVDEMKTPGGAEPASVMILLYPEDGHTTMVFMKRPEYDGVHSGQISFPGGHREPGDMDDVHTALRECTEEIGVDEGDITVIGKLTKLYIPPSNYLVTPVVGYTPSKPDFIPDPAEVAGVLEVRLTELMDEKLLINKKIMLGPGFHITAPAFCPNGYVIWGATAMILNELLEVIRKHQLFENRT